MPILVRRFWLTVERSARLDGGLVKLDVGDRVACRIRERRAEAVIATDVQRATALDPPSTSNGVGGVDVGGVGQDERARRRASPWCWCQRWLS